MKNGSGSAIAPMAHHLTTISPGAELWRTQNFHRGGVLVPGPAMARVGVDLGVLAYTWSWPCSPRCKTPGIILHHGALLHQHLHRASDLIHHPTLSSTRSTHRCAASRHRTRVLSPAPAATSAPACRADTRADTAGLTLLSPELMAGA